MEDWNTNQQTQPTEGPQNLVVALCILAIILAGVLSGAFFDHFGFGDWWSITLLFGSLSAFLFADATLSYYGFRHKYRGKIALVVLLAQESAVFVQVALRPEMRQLVPTPEDFAGYVFIIAVIVAFAFFFAAAVDLARWLRLILGIQYKGEPDDASVVLRVAPASLIDNYGSEFLESEIEYVIEDAIQSDSEFTSVDRDKSRIEYKVGIVDDTRVLFRIEGGLVQIVFVPLDGRVSRFVEAKEQARYVRFALSTRFHFEEPTKDERELSMRQLSEARDKFGSKRLKGVAFGNIRKALMKIPISSAVGMIVAAVLVILVLMDSPINRLLGDAEISRALVSIGAIVTMYMAFRRILEKKK
jgi:hypothetical protein